MIISGNRSGHPYRRWSWQFCSLCCSASRGISIRCQALTFPAKFCNDHGRRINNLGPDWPDSLEGFAKKAYDYYVKELKPLGYKLTAQILDFPDGMPGTVGIFLSWDR